VIIADEENRGQCPLQAGDILPVPGLHCL